MIFRSSTEDRYVAFQIYARFFDLEEEPARENTLSRTKTSTLTATVPTAPTTCEPPDLPILALCFGSDDTHCRYFIREAKPPKGRELYAILILRATARRHYGTHRGPNTYRCDAPPLPTLWCLSVDDSCLTLREVPPPQRERMYQRIEIKRYAEITLELITDKNRRFVTEGTHLFTDPVFGHQYRIAPLTAMRRRQ